MKRAWMCKGCDSFCTRPNSEDLQAKKLVDCEDLSKVFPVAIIPLSKYRAMAGMVKKARELLNLKRIPFSHSIDFWDLQDKRETKLNKALAKLDAVEEEMKIEITDMISGIDSYHDEYVFDAGHILELPDDSIKVLSPDANDVCVNCGHDFDYHNSDGTCSFSSQKHNWCTCHKFTPQEKPVCKSEDNPCDGCDHNIGLSEYICELGNNTDTRICFDRKLKPHPAPVANNELVALEKRVAELESHKELLPLLKAIIDGMFYLFPVNGELVTRRRNSISAELKELEKGAKQNANLGK